MWLCAPLELLRSSSLSPGLAELSDHETLSGSIMIIEAEEDSKQTLSEALRISTATDAPSTSVVLQPEIPPPYSPRETDPLLRHAAPRKKATLAGRCRHAVLKSLPLILVGVTTAALTYWTMNAARPRRYPPSRRAQVREHAHCAGSFV
jgi:hypothetical protein